MCSPVCSSTVIGCTYDLPSGIYNMYVYDIEEEDRLSDDWAISSTNITITGLEPTYPSLEVICPVCFVSMVTVLHTTETCDCRRTITFNIVILYNNIDDTQMSKSKTAGGILGGNNNNDNFTHIVNININKF